MTSRCSLALLIVLSAACAVCGLAHAQDEALMTPTNLLCEYRVNPMGIDATPPRLSWTLQSDRRGAKQTAYQILVASTEEGLSKDQGDLWDSGKVASPSGTLQPFGGAALQSRQRCFWKVRVWDENDRVGAWSEPARWSMGLLNAADWQCSYIKFNEADGDPNCPWMRKTFTLDYQPSDARVYVNTLGYYELYINGAKIDENPMTPAPTQFSKRSYYLVHDVAKYLKPGKNCIGLWISRGWFAPGLFGVTHNGPIARAQLEIGGPDGQKQTIGTGADWKTRMSSITVLGKGSSGHYGGEKVEMVKYEPAWATPDYDDSAWLAVQVVNDVPEHTVCAQRVGPNRVRKSFAPRVIRPFGEKTWLIDFGTCLTGSFDIRFVAPKAGEEVAFDFYDSIANENDLHNFSQRDVYVSDGKTEGHFATHFNYHAYRYARVTGIETPPREEDVTAGLIYSEHEPLTTFACSNPLLTDIHDMIFYTFQCLSLGGNLVDCPHIERLGYGGDGHASTPSMLTMYNSGAMYTGWLEHWQDCQREDGDMPHTAPNTENAGGGPFWCAFIIGASRHVATLYNDHRILESNYPAMQRWLDGYVESRCKDDLLMGWENKPYRNWYLGDWAQPGRLEKEREKSTHLVNNCVRIMCYDYMASIATELGKADDAKRYKVKADALRPKVHAKFYDEANGTYADDTQIDLAYALLVDVVPENLRGQMLKRLEDDIVVKRQGHLDVGLVGIPILVACALKYDRSDLIFTVLNQDTFPGYGHMLKNGATTTWEHWDGDRSLIHNCYNGIGVWFYRGLAGILPDAEAGFVRPTLRPAIVGDLTWAQARQETVAGTFASHWRVEQGNLVWNIEVPPGVESATVMVPASKADAVQESGKPAAESEGVSAKGMQGAYAVFEVKSGKYEFTAPR
ncbi:MAG: glycoside hydrolase family 78 protein [Candidatus Hydrogenedentes bacterium]|nr:glycoside hydrolase family 78 protein [Candidatus Hydrogenedentota bacterium]